MRLQNYQNTNLESYHLMINYLEESIKGWVVIMKELTVMRNGKILIINPALH
jgi:hypothetical protein